MEISTAGGTTSRNTGSGGEGGGGRLVGHCYCRERAGADGEREDADVGNTVVNTVG